MEVLRLRKMSYKSVIGISQYKHVTVQSLLNTEQYRALISLYYSLSKISFVDEILELLEITKEHQIEKPGKIEDYAQRQDMANAASKRVWAKKDLTKKEQLSENAVMGIAARNKKKRRVGQVVREHNRYSSAADRQSYNQGKI